jgi:hypothetical protein
LVFLVVLVFFPVWLVWLVWLGVWCSGEDEVLAQLVVGSAEVSVFSGVAPFAYRVRGRPLAANAA